MGKELRIYAVSENSHPVHPLPYLTAKVSVNWAYPPHNRLQASAYHSRITVVCFSFPLECLFSPTRKPSCVRILLSRLDCPAPDGLATALILPPGFYPGITASNVRATSKQSRRYPYGQNRNLTATDDDAAHIPTAYPSGVGVISTCSGTVTPADPGCVSPDDPCGVGVYSRVGVRVILNRDSQGYSLRGSPK